MHHDDQDQDAGYVEQLGAELVDQALVDDDLGQALDDDGLAVRLGVLAHANLPARGGATASHWSR
ncbi:hypothetical protein [Streptomyces prunicolor]|uniref:hypothetical protein n=1 Tax=Streptomyces prunicolor TaxID=67348 RepID=UPI0033D06C15